MHRVRLDELMRAWLEALSRSDDESVAAKASYALELHAQLCSHGTAPDRAGAAMRYVRLVETLMSSAARPARAVSGLEARQGAALHARPSGNLERFWSQALQNLKRRIEAESAPPVGDPPPGKS